MTRQHCEALTNGHPQLADAKWTDPEGVGVRGEDSLVHLQELSVLAWEESRLGSDVEPLDDVIKAFDLSKTRVSKHHHSSREPIRTPSTFVQDIFIDDGAPDRN